MVIDNACRLEKRINNHGTGERAAPLFKSSLIFLIKENWQANHHYPADDEQ